MINHLLVSWRVLFWCSLCCFIFFCIKHSLKAYANITNSRENCEKLKKKYLRKTLGKRERITTNTQKIYKKPALLMVDHIFAPVESWRADDKAIFWIAQCAIYTAKHFQFFGMCVYVVLCIYWHLAHNTECHIPN